ncbi:ArsR/SmtB family transcription factor [Flavilitoribacter nigricans]|uniref:Transcriptional regulator n=1 Tax=Flavilitoribacter nigricans (strain ATCC 23147 / DSM 23189 / NBRC 102662 / NCIMB 1420 / SS-2) TaxID=1122177 RepID=A0A2D0N5Z7_FLAN2|nr:metalloregulator ArsR/SmtB family transcription factor [Flavilitoribacter nigricans]PHN03952.1 transcriptional regulator [Flavilitoribacter nigricans DSM 23189 = NBRC 102662]
MGATKSDLFTEKQNQLADIAKVLGHPARIAIVQYLLEVNACIGGEIVDHIPLAQPTISRHLKELKSVGLIKGTIEGTSISYCIDGERWKEIQSLFNGLFDAYQLGDTCC